jgi:hypothetical protein
MDVSGRILRTWMAYRLVSSFWFQVVNWLWVILLNLNQGLETSPDYACLEEKPRESVSPRSKPRVNCVQNVRFVQAVQSPSLVLPRG